MVPRFLRHPILSVRDLLSTAGPVLALAVLLIWAAYVALDPTPPRQVVLATGAGGGAYAEFGKRYVEELRRYGVTVELRPTGGAAENLRLLRDPGEKVDLAFVQGGASDALYAVDEDPSGLVSLGSLFYEPVWVFYREDAARRLGREARDKELARDGRITRVSQLASLRVNVGPDGSGAANLVAKLLHANRIEISEVKTSRLNSTPAVVALLSGELDALVLVSAPESGLVRMLLQTPGIQTYDAVQAEAYARSFPFLEALRLPRGVVDLAKDIPPEDIHLVAPTASLLAREKTHPAIVQLFAQAAQRIHSGPNWFARANQFPSMKDNGTIPIADEAERFYRNGTPFLQRYLPFWLSNLVDRMWVVLLSLVAILIPLSRIVPPLYEFRVRSRVFRWYAQLREIEAALADAKADRARLRADLESLDDRVGHIRVPLSHADEVYALRSHIELIRARLDKPAPAQG
jgi:TRAP-type uncharacterized transport system substrate-binding protein